MGVVVGAVAAEAGLAASVGLAEVAVSAAAVPAVAGDKGARMAKMTLEQLVEQLRTAYGADLRSIVLYGSAAAGEHIAKRSDYNVLVIVDSLSMQKLRAAAAVARAWAEAGNPAPMTLTTREWRGSADIFAMEYADILERHRVLHGQLPADVRVRPEDLRLQLEHEAMGTLLQLRRGALAVGHNSKEQIARLEQASSTVMVLFRALLRLHGEQPPQDNVALSERVAAIAGIDAAPFVRVVRHRRNEQSVPSEEARALLGAYLTGVEGLVQYLDRYSASAR